MESQSPHAVFNFPLNCPSAPNELSYPHHVPRRFPTAYKVLMRMTRILEYQQTLPFISTSAIMEGMGAEQSFHPKRTPQAIRFPSSNAVPSHLPPTQNVQWTDTTNQKQVRSVPDDPLIIHNIATLRLVLHPPPPHEAKTKRTFCINMRVPPTQSRSYLHFTA